MANRFRVSTVIGRRGEIGYRVDFKGWLFWRFYFEVDTIEQLCQGLNHSLQPDKYFTEGESVALDQLGKS